MNRRSWSYLPASERKSNTNSDMVVRIMLDPKLKNPSVFVIRGNVKKSCSR